MYPVWQHPAFVIISAQPQLLLLISSHPTTDHTKSSILSFIIAAVECRLETLPSDVILPLRHALRAELLFFAVLHVHQHSSTLNIAQSLLPSHSSLNSPGVRPLHLSHVSHCYFFVSNSARNSWRTKSSAGISRDGDVVAVRHSHGDRKTDPENRNRTRAFSALPADTPQFLSGSAD